MHDQILKKAATFIFVCMSIILVLLSPLLLIIGMFTGLRVDDTRDNYEKAFDLIGCDSSYAYQLIDVRYFDGYTYPEMWDHEDIPKEMLAERLKNDYFVMKKADDGQKQICLLRQDEEIYQTLQRKYNVPDGDIEEMRTSILQIRNGRSNFKEPIIQAKIIRDFSEENPNLLFEVEKGTKVYASDAGTVSLVKTQHGGGVVVEISHIVQRGFLKNGNVDARQVVSIYTGLQDIKVEEGDEIEQGTLIGKAAVSEISFALRDEKGNYLDPKQEILFSTGEIAMPLDDPFQVTSPFGERDLDNFHYGLDVSKEFGAAIYSITDGEVVETNNTCAPDNGGTPSKCPSDSRWRLCGNFVIIKSERDGDVYYIIYMHMKETAVEKGNIVYAGQMIGYQGNSGNSYGSHVHIEINKNKNVVSNKESAIDPNEWLQLTQEEEDVGN